ncbi:biotinidase [Sardina pilchardus]|uniref:biotinidase n=1 Tax=Sardina pilchardus TaxID=27697 RepID=UPI002E0D1867
MCLGIINMSPLRLAVLWLSMFALPSALTETPSYVAAVYEHLVVLNPNPRVALGRRAALEHMQKNLVVFEEQAALAARQGAQILVFPEDAIQGFNFTRASIAGYLEAVPDPTVVIWNPCSERDRFPDTEVLQRLSCMARKNSLYLVANMAAVQVCNSTADAHCPPDGRYQFNTNVVFASDGSLVARYRKQNLYFEAAFDKPPQMELVTFSTPFAGRFGVFTCFDILFREPAVALVEDLGVRQLVYPTAWMNQLPLLAAVQFQRSFSHAAAVTVLAANVRALGLGMTGSGIFTPWQEVHQHDMVGETGRLLVSRVPVLDPDRMARGGESTRLAWLPFSGHRKREPGLGEAGDAHGWPREAWHSVDDSTPRGPATEYCSPVFEHCPVGPAYETPVVFHSIMMYDNFTLVPLQDTKGNLTVCDGSLCCHLLFKRATAPSTELYALGAFQGLHVVHGTYYLEVCALVKCTGPDFASCGGETEHAQTQIDFRLEGNFSSRHVFPGILGNGMVLDIPDESGKKSDGWVYMRRSGMTAGLVTATLYSRVYEKDNS